MIQPIFRGLAAGVASYDTAGAKPTDYNDFTGPVPHGFFRIPGILRGFFPRHKQRFTRKTVPAEIGCERIKAMTQSIIRRKILALVGTAVVLAVWGCVTSAQAEGIRHSTSGDLFYNYYVPPVGCGSVGAQLYPCPRPTPPLVGQTYITYQPLMPHEFLYPHARVYWTQHEDALPTRTSVRWRGSLVPHVYLNKSK
jgi:hypothetical protein